MPKKKSTISAATGPGQDRKPSRERQQREAPEVRRKSLIQATMRSIGKYGYAGTTVEKICGEAQVSRGLINHHFDTKEELIRQSYRDLCEEWSFQTREMVEAISPDPEEKLRAMIRIAFGPALFKQDYIGIWVGFWGAVGKSPTLKKLNREMYRQDREIYQRSFEEIATQRGLAIDARNAAIALLALMDGLSLQWSLDPKGFTAEEAQAVCLDFVTRTLA
jgi:AcrR family transcriptional regulator